MRPRTILIVDDNPSSADTLELALMDLAGFETLTVPNGERAWQMLREADVGRLAAVITDLQMPAMDGFELIARIRADSRYGRLPILVISASADPGTMRRAHELGANVFLAKPWSSIKLHHRLEQLLYGASGERASS